MPSLLDYLMAPGRAEADTSESLGTPGTNPLIAAFLKLQADRVKDAVTAPRDAYTGDLQVFDPATGHTTQDAADRAGGMAGLAMTGGLGGATSGGSLLGSGPVRKFGSMEELLAASRASKAAQQLRATEIADMLGSKGRFSTTGKRGETIGVTQSAREGGRFQVTTFDDGSPTGHVLFDDPMQAANFIAANEAVKSSSISNLGMGVPSQGLSQ